MSKNTKEMINIFEILSPLIIAIITGVITFLITKYTYHNNKPLDKLEITYNRLYYPIYRLILNTQSVDEDFIEKCNMYFNKYNKYLDKSTKNAFNVLKEESKSKEAYRNFTNNIYKKSSYLRYKLGYLDSSFIDMYSTYSKHEQRLIKLLFSFTIFYVSLLFLKLFQNTILENFFSSITLITLTIFIYQLICSCILFFKKIIKRLFD